MNLSEQEFRDRNEKSWQELRTTMRQVLKNMARNPIVAASDFDTTKEVFHTMLAACETRYRMRRIDAHNRAIKYHMSLIKRRAVQARRSAMGAAVKQISQHLRNGDIEGASSVPGVQVYQIPEGSTSQDVERLLRNLRTNSNGNNVRNIRRGLQGGFGPAQ